jgi:hypothetical protein
MGPQMLDSIVNTKLWTGKKEFTHDVKSPNVQYPSYRR